MYFFVCISKLLECHDHLQNDRSPVLFRVSVFTHSCCAWNFVCQKHRENKLLTPCTLYIVGKEKFRFLDLKNEEKLLSVLSFSIRDRHLVSAIAGSLIKNLSIFVRFHAQVCILLNRVGLHVLRTMWQWLKDAWYVFRLNSEFLISWLRTRIVKTTNTKFPLVWKPCSHLLTFNYTNIGKL